MDIDVPVKSSYVTVIHDTKYRYNLLLINKVFFSVELSVARL